MAVTLPRGMSLRRVGDALLAGALLVFLVAAVPTPVVTDPAGIVGAPHVRLGGHWEAGWWAWTLQLGLVLPLAWRRRAPRTVLVAVSAVAFVQYLAGPALYGDLALLVAIYTVASRDSGARAYALVASVIIAAALLGAERWAGDSTLATVLSLPPRSWCCRPPSGWPSGHGDRRSPPPARARRERSGPASRGRCTTWWPTTSR